MVLFCEDVDLAVVDAAVFGEEALGHLALVRGAAGTLTGTALTLASASLTAAGVTAGMVAKVTAGESSVWAEITAVAGALTATIGVLRASRDEAAVAIGLSGAVNVTVVSFRPQIALVGREVLRSLGIGMDQEDALPAMKDPAGCRAAVVFGTLARLYEALSDTTMKTSETLAKAQMYRQAYDALRRAAAVTVDADGDGVAEDRRRGGVGRLERV